MGDYASNGPSAVNSRENTGLYPQSDRFALISHNSAGLYPSNCQFAVISHNPPRFPTNSNARMGNHPKQTGQRIKSRTSPRLPALAPASASRRQPAPYRAPAHARQQAPAPTSQRRQRRPEPTSTPPSDQNPTPPAARQSPVAHRPSVVQYCNTVCHAARALDRGSG